MSGVPEVGERALPPRRRHAELAPAFIVPVIQRKRAINNGAVATLRTAERKAEWTLKRVQGDELG